MDLTFVQQLTEEPGPFATVYVDASHDTEDAGHAGRLRWDCAWGELADLGADDATLAALDAAVTDSDPPTASPPSCGSRCRPGPDPDAPDRRRAPVRGHPCQGGPGPGRDDGRVRMADITDLILDEHEWFRRRFAALDHLQAQDPVDVEAVRAVWQPLADHLDVHAIAEERIFYPQLLRFGEDPEDETLDAIGDHNDIRDGVHEAGRYPVGTAEWWAAVGKARKANDEHMGEEEREGLSDFRQHAPAGLREALGAQFADFLAAHRTTAGLDTSDKDPQGYVRAVERDIAAGPGDGSLGIGSLRGR